MERLEDSYGELVRVLDVVRFDIVLRVEFADGQYAEVVDSDVVLLLNGASGVGGERCRSRHISVSSEESVVYSLKKGWCGVLKNIVDAMIECGDG